MTLAVERDFSAEGEKQTDFIDVVAWRGAAEFVSKYFTKGRMAASLAGCKSEAGRIKRAARERLPRWWQIRFTLPILNAMQSPLPRTFMLTSPR